MTASRISFVTAGGFNTPATIRYPGSGRPMPFIRVVPDEVVTRPLVSLIKNYRHSTESPSDSEQNQTRLTKRVLNAGWRASKILVGATAAVTFPFTTAITAIDHSPGETTEAGGFTITIKPQIGSDFSQLPLFGLLGGDNEQAHRTVLGKNVGVSVIPDGENDVDPYDKSTREAWSYIYNHRQPFEDHIASVAQHDAEVWGLAGFSAGLLAEISLAAWVARRRRPMAEAAESELEILRAHFRDNGRFVAAAAAMAVLLSGAGTANALTRDVHRTVPGGSQLYGLIKQAEPFFQLGQANEQHDNRTAANLQYEASYNPLLEVRPGFQRAVITDDLENNNGQARMFGLAIKLLHANYGVMLGDWATFEDRKLGLYTADTAYFESGKKPIYTAGGLHETSTGMQYLKDNGIILPNNQTLDLNGTLEMFLRSYGVTQINQLGSDGKSVPRNPKLNYQKNIEAVVKKICQTRPRFVDAHDHKYLEDVMENLLTNHPECAPSAVFGGRLDITKMPLNKDGTYANKSVVTKIALPEKGAVKEFINDSGAGNDTHPNYGIIKNPGDFVVRDYNPLTNETILTVITINPDSSLHVTQRELIKPSPFAPDVPQAPPEIGSIGNLTSRPANDHAPDR